ncbi:MAG: bi-domain-containing oxidoreductase [Acidimicrobiia bacterium]
MQSVRSGELRIVDAPEPAIGPADVLVRTTRSLVSAGTERAVRHLASAGLLAKAKARPELVRQVLRKASVDGIAATVRSVQSRLDEDMPLGYSAAGVVLAVGEAVERLRPGMRVATGSAGHAELQAVPGLLAVAVPDEVDDESAAFATVAAIALQGIRQAEVGPGSRVAVIGLGLIGQLTVRLLQAAGCSVAGIDVRDWTVDRARASGAFSLVEAGDETTAALVDWSRGRGCDAIIITAATTSPEPVRRAAAIARDRATVVVVGDVRLDFARTPYYEKELNLRFARSYGPGRYERSYEHWGIDFPVGYVPFAQGRNLETFVDLVASRRVDVADLVTHTFAIDDAEDAYAVLDRPGEAYLGVLLSYPQTPTPYDSTRELAASHRGLRAKLAPRRRGDSVGFVGAGAFVRTVLLPAFAEAGFTKFTAVASSSGTSAVHLAERAGFARVGTHAHEIVTADDIDVAVIATPHDSHAALVGEALRNGKHVFCEKPLALSVEELSDVAAVWHGSSTHLQVGFNRRFSPTIAKARAVFGRAASGPVIITYRVSAGILPSKHWYRDRRQGGRLLGEVCHFVDTCAALVGESVVGVYATGSGRGEALLDQDLALTLQFDDGSMAVVTYATGGHTGTAKEHIEILGRGHTAVIDDFRSLTVDGNVVWKGTQDKGHVAQVVAFRDAIRHGDGDELTRAAFATTAATMAAASSLLTGGPVVPEKV